MNKVFDTFSHLILKNYLRLMAISSNLSDDLLMPLNFENAAISRLSAV